MAGCQIGVVLGESARSESPVVVRSRLIAPFIAAIFAGAFRHRALPPHHSAAPLAATLPLPCRYPAAPLAVTRCVPACECRRCAVRSGAAIDELRRAAIGRASAPAPMRTR